MTVAKKRIPGSGRWADAKAKENRLDGAYVAWLQWTHAGRVVSAQRGDQVPFGSDAGFSAARNFVA